MELKRPVTLRIKEAEILESQLSGDDLSTLKGGGETGLRPLVCPAVYCEAGYSSGAGGETGSITT
jgi:hypothetical protein